MDLPRKAGTFAYAPAMGELFANAFTTRAPVDLRKGYDASMQQNQSQIAPAMFHMENIKGPVLFVAAGDDQIWNSVALSQTGLTYLQQHRHAYSDALLQYPRAGHIFLYASSKRPMTTAPMGPVTLLLGGTPQANVEAAAQAWPKIFAFLSEALK